MTKFLDNIAGPSNLNAGDIQELKIECSVFHENHLEDSFGKSETSSDMLFDPSRSSAININIKSLIRSISGISPTRNISAINPTRNIMESTDIKPKISRVYSLCTLFFPLYSFFFFILYFLKNYKLFNNENH